MVVSFLLFLTVSPSIFNASGAGTQGFIPRHDILYATGYHVRPPNFNPEMHWGYAYGAYFMYDPLFDWNNSDPENPVMMKFLGQTVSWNTAGSVLTITMREGCKWSDGEAITSADVNFTYRECVHDVDIMVKTTGITIVDDLTFTVNMRSGYEFSQQIFDVFTRRKGILPAHVWAEAKTEHGEDAWYAWTNDWFDEDYKDEWKVTSGPYKPHFYSDTQDEEIFIINEKCWAFDDDVTKDATETKIYGEVGDHPKYISHLHYPSNSAGATALMRNEVDWSAKFVPQVWEAIQANPNITTYTDGKAPYYRSESSIVELCFNMKRFPFTEKWFREMIGYAIDYDNAINVAASGYIRRARVGRIDNETATHSPFYSAEVEAEYAFDYDYLMARDILEANTFEDGGVRYVNNVSEAYTSVAPPDAFPAMPGHQAILANRTFQILVPGDWSDSVALTQAVAYSIDGLGIPCVAKPADSGVWDGGFNTGAYDMSYHTGSAKTQQPAFEAFNWMVGSISTWDHNPWDWKYGESNTTLNPYYNSTFQDLLDDFDTATGQDAIDLAEDMQRIIAEELPSIPIAYNAIWYTVNDKYWKNWPSESNAWLQPTAPWSTANPGAMQRLVMGLRATGEKDTSTSSTDVEIIPALFAIVMVAFFTTRRKRE